MAVPFPGFVPQSLDCSAAAGQDRKMTFSGQMAGERALSGGDLAAALAWWRDAGVDHDYADAPHAWLKPAVEEAAEIAAPAPHAEPAPPRERIGGDPAEWPKDLAAFAAWWLSEPLLDGGQVAGRVAPRGAAGAKIMVLVDHPEAQDSEQLLSGPQGKLLGAILAALGIGPEQAYIAAALPRHMPLPDWPALGEAGLGDITAHHIALAAPKRLLVLSSHVSSLLGHDPANSSGFLPNLDQEGAKVPALVAPGLESLAARPRGKARLWQALLDWQAA
jgi:uracil-DNA glycosylase